MRTSLLVNKFGLSSKVLKTLSFIPNKGRLLFEKSSFFFERIAIFKFDISEGNASFRFNFLIFSFSKPISSQSQKSYMSIRSNSDKFFLIIYRLLLFESVMTAKFEGLALRASINLVESLP